MKTQATNSTLGDLLAKISNKTLIPQPDFQRRLVWNNKDKKNFIKTVLEEYPFPEIYLATGELNQETGERTQLIVDGQQRMTTLYQYFKNSPDLVLPRDFPSYLDLSPEQKDNFLQYSVVIRDLGKLPMQEIKEIFQRINSTSYGLKYMEVRNARYAGAFKSFNEEFSNNIFFENHKFFSPSEIHRMDDLLYCSIITSTILSTYFNSSKDVEKFLERYDEEFPVSDILKNNYEKIFNLIDNLELNEYCRIYNKADFFSLFVELYNLQFKEKKNLTIKKLRYELAEFYSSVDDCNDKNSEETIFYEYYKATLQNTSSRSSRITRGRIIKDIISKAVI